MFRFFKEMMSSFLAKGNEHAPDFLINLMGVAGWTKIETPPSL